jgi:prepilin-type N-terminal cleavage/methylation domain-containing protein
MIRQSLLTVRNNFHKSFGFTLVELMVVISIIAILGSVGASTYVGVTSRARDARRKQDLQQLKTALSLYYLDNQKLPNQVDCGSSGLVAPCVPFTTFGWQRLSTYYPTIPAWIDSLPPKYIIQEPVDPYNTGFYPCDTNGDGIIDSFCGSGTTSMYIYEAVINAAAAPYNRPCFSIAATLENSSDPDIVTKKDVKWCDGSSVKTTIQTHPGIIYPNAATTYMIVVRF